jgi:hypothetical protein
MVNPGSWFPWQLLRDLQKQAAAPPNSLRDQDRIRPRNGGLTLSINALERKQPHSAAFALSP